MADTEHEQNTASPSEQPAPDADAVETALDEHSIPEEVTADYANEGVRAAMRAVLETPDYERLAAFLTSLREGYLVVDVTGTPQKKRGPRVRTIRSTKGQLVLPVFTSMDELRALAKATRHDQLKGAVMPAHEALSLIATDRFVAAEFDKANAALVILRKYIMLVLGGEEITAATLEGMK